MIEVFVIDGSERNLADIIIANKISGDSLCVASYGFGVKQVRRLMNAFKKMVLVADTSHSQLNNAAWKSITKMSNENPRFLFIPTAIHAKLAIIDEAIVVFTSANLSANQRIESYIIGNKNEMNGIDDIANFLFHQADSFLEETIIEPENDFSVNLESVSYDLLTGCNFEN